MHRKRVAVLVILLAIFGTSPLFAAGIGTWGRTELLPVHIVTMSLSTAGMIVGWYIARFLRTRNKQWLKLHRGFQWSSAILAVLGIVTGVVMVENTTGIHLRVTHAIIALVSLVLIVGAISAAYLFLKGKKAKKQLRLVHRWTGRFAILAFLVTIFFGLFAAGVL